MPLYSQFCQKEPFQNALTSALLEKWDLLSFPDSSGKLWKVAVKYLVVYKSNTAARVCKSEAVWLLQIERSVKRMDLDFLFPGGKLGGLLCFALLLWFIFRVRLSWTHFSPFFLGLKILVRLQIFALKSLGFFSRVFWLEWFVFRRLYLSLTVLCKLRGQIQLRSKGSHQIKGGR